MWVTSFVLFCFVTYPSVLVSAYFLGDIWKKEVPHLPGVRELPIDKTAGKGLDDSTIASGLKEALAIGTKKAVNLISTFNGYYGNKAIKLLLPDRSQKADKQGSPS